MKYRIVAVGKIKAAYLREGIAEYTKRLRPYGGVSIVEVAEAYSPERASAREIAARIEEEGERLLRHIKPEDYVLLLDVDGALWTSPEWAAHLDAAATNGTSEAVFVIGGAFGVSDALRRRAAARISLGRVTYTHQIARFLLTEQLYRAEKINRHEPYHW